MVCRRLCYDASRMADRPREEEEQIGTTPILNLKVPPPNARRKTFISRVVPIVIGVLIGRVPAAESDRGSPDRLGSVRPLAYLAALAGGVLVHELGHVCAGWAVRFHFRAISVGPFSLSIENGKLKMRTRREMFLAGSALMQIDRICRLRRRLMFYIVAGPMANLISVPAAAILINVCFPEAARLVGLGNSRIFILRLL